MKVFLITATALLALSSCSKSSNDNNTGGGGSGGNGGGGGTAITVTAITPANPYPEDQIVITGTGFNPDKTKDTVEFGDKSSFGFHPYHDGGSTGYQSQIISATATQLVISAVNTYDLNFSNFVGDQNKTVLQIKANGKTYMTDIIQFKHGLALNLINNANRIAYVTGCLDLIQPGDSIYLDGGGFYKPSTLYIDGVAIPTAKFQDNTITRCNLRIPPTVFGEQNNSCLQRKVKFKIVNADGRSVEREYDMPQSPPMVVNDVKFDKASYSHADVSANFTIKGYALYNTTMMKITGSTGYSSEAAVGGIGGYPNQVTQVLTLGALPATTGGTTYNVFIKKSMSDTYGFPIANFILTP